jgi:hypothetical protein
VDGVWNQEDPEKWLTIIQVPAEKGLISGVRKNSQTHAGWRK